MFAVQMCVSVYSLVWKAVFSLFAQAPQCEIQLRIAVRCICADQWI